MSCACNGDQSFINNGETSTSLNEINNTYFFFLNTAKAPLCHNRENRRLCSSGTKYIVNFRLCQIQFRNFDKQMKCDDIIVFLCKKLSL